MATGKVHFTEDQSTNLATLYGRMLDSQTAKPLLGDPTAVAAVAKIDYDFGKFKMDTDMATSVAARAKQFDDWGQRFLAEHPDATVLHLGCGMDSRVYRLDPAPTVQWFDVDFPDVIELRRQVYPDRENYRMIGSSVTDLTWLTEVPDDRRTLVIAEGLMMYLDPDDGLALLRGLISRFSGGEIMFDTFSRLGIKLQKANPVVRRARATLRWGIDDSHDLEKLGLVLLEELDAGAFVVPDVLDRMSWRTRLAYRMTVAIPALRNLGRLVRYRFGD